MTRHQKVLADCCGGPSARITCSAMAATGSVEMAPATWEKEALYICWLLHPTIKRAKPNLKKCIIINFRRKYNIYHVTNIWNYGTQINLDIFKTSEDVNTQINNKYAVILLRCKNQGIDFICSIGLTKENPKSKCNCALTRFRGMLSASSLEPFLPHKDVYRSGLFSLRQNTLSSPATTKLRDIQNLACAFDQTVPECSNVLPQPRDKSSRRLNEVIQINPNMQIH